MARSLTWKTWLAAVLLATAPAAASERRADWQVLSAGGREAASENFVLSGTVGQTAAAAGASENRALSQGFWQKFGGCCVGIRGNANDDPEGRANVADVTFLVAYMFGIPAGSAPMCPDEANVNGDPMGKVNVSDVTYLIDWLMGNPSGPQPRECP
jgi:hypothetical protein